MKPLTRLFAAMAAVLVTGALPQTPAHAAPSPFPTCDGFGPPSRHADGMTAEASWIFTSVGADPNKVRQDVGEVGVDACDAALSDPALLPAYWMRKVNLLRARALHNLGKHDIPAALADLDHADAAQDRGADIYYARSLGLGLGFVRAYALRQSGEGGRGVELALKTLEQRPFSRQAIIAALAAVGSAAPRDQLNRLAIRAAQLTPLMITPPFQRVFVDNAPVPPERVASISPNFSAKDLFNDLPDAETRDLIPAYKEAKRPLLAMRGSVDDMQVQGWRTSVSAGGITTIEFRSRKASAALVEEGALLRAAEMALQAGKRGFIVTERHEIHLNLDTVQYGMVTNEGLLTRQAFLDVVFVDPGNLPLAFSGQEWRVIDATAVKNALAPIFIP